jgi:RimJ/RimL family protein N-acetyltransferase
MTSARLIPVAATDEDAICELLWNAEVCGDLGDGGRLPRATVQAMIRESLDPASVVRCWRIADAAEAATAGLVGLCTPGIALTRLRAIGWRSLELLVVLDPAWRGRGLATSAVAEVVARAGADGVTFALLGGVDEPNLRAHRLMRRCGFGELGRLAGTKHARVVYERTV